MRSIQRILLLCAISILASACASPPKLQDLGIVVDAPKAPALIPPVLKPPPSYSFQMRLQQIFVGSPSMPTSSPTTTWSATANPDQWFPMDNWPGIRANIDQIAADCGVEVIDCGTPDCQLDVGFLYDPFHPSAKGYREIFGRYKNWLGTGALRIVGDSTDYSQIATGSLRIKTIVGVIALPLHTVSSGPTRVKTGSGVFQL